MKILKNVTDILTTADFHNKLSDISAKSSVNHKCALFPSFHKLHIYMIAQHFSGNKCLL